MGNLVGGSCSKEEDQEFSDEDAQELISPEKRGIQFSRSLSHPSNSSTDVKHAVSYKNRHSMHERRSYTDNSSTDYSKQNANLKFYENKKKTKPEPGWYIKEILKWYGDYEMLESRRFYIQWLFPTKSPSTVNMDCQPLQEHEAAAIRNSQKLMKRAYQAYNMMLNFYGMQPVLEWDHSFKVKRSPNWAERYAHLNSARHNLLRITRIISSMGEMGFGQHQLIWLRFLLIEAVQHKTLYCIQHDTVNFWIEALPSDNDRVEMFEFYIHLKSLNETVPSPIQSNTEDEVQEMNSKIKEYKDNLISFNEESRTTAGLAIQNSPNGRAEAMDGEECDMDVDYEDEILYDNLYSENGCVFMENDCHRKEHCVRNMDNVQFYLNQIKSRPGPGIFLKDLKDDVDFNLMLNMHRHIQWLFPTPDLSAMNPEAVPLREEEARVFEKCKELRERFISVYGLLLTCYGMDIVSKETGEIRKIKGWEEKFRIIEHLPGLPKTITRILTCLGALGFVKYQVPLVYFLLNEAMVERTLPSLDGPNVEYWIGVIVDNEQRQMIADAWMSFKGAQQRHVPPDWNLPQLKKAVDVSALRSDSLMKSKPDTEISNGAREKHNVTEKSKGVKEKSSSATKESRLIGTKVTKRPNANVEFYNNYKKSSFIWGYKIEDMLRWKGDYYKLEINHQYIQWLFPIPEGNGMNPSAQALEPHEAEEIGSSPILKRRVLRAFEMMLDFYGMKLASENSEQIQRSVNWKERYHHLNRSGHNHLRITRIIKSLGYLGLKKHQTPWVKFILHEVFVTKVLPKLGGRQLMYWIEAISDEIEKEHVYTIYVTLKEG